MPMGFIRFFLLSFAVLFWFAPSFAKEIKTNAVVMDSAPEWLSATRVETVTEKIQYRLEWTTRRVKVFWYTDQAEFEKIHGLGPVPVAVSINAEKTQAIHLGPKINAANFDGVFGHELVHIIFYQKYRGAIPAWLEEGLANHLAEKKQVDYAWLNGQPLPNDVRSLTHPYKGEEKAIGYHYKASQALAEMLDRKCGLENLLRLSVQRKMEDYIRTYCEITDINQAFAQWLRDKSSRR